MKIFLFVLSLFVFVCVYSDAESKSSNTLVFENDIEKTEIFNFTGLRQKTYKIISLKDTPHKYCVSYESNDTRDSVSVPLDYCLALKEKMQK